MALREVFIQALKPIGLIYLEGNGVKHAIVSDGFGCFEEIFFKQVYFDAEEISRADVVIDLGAHQGTFTIYSALNIKPNGMIISVEPNPKTYSILLENIRLSKHLILEKNLKIHVINRAVYISKKIIKLKLTRWSEISYISTSGNLDVQTITLEEIFSLFHHLKDPTILLKMDIEGSERILLADKQSLELLKKCWRIAIEPHGDLNRIKEALERLGFRISVQNITLEPTLCREWLRYKPKLYTRVIATCRFIASSIAKPKVTIVKAER